MARTRFFCDNQWGITQKLRKREQSFLSVTLRLDLIYVSIKYHEDILKIDYGRTVPCRKTSICFKTGV